MQGCRAVGNRKERSLTMSNGDWDDDEADRYEMEEEGYETDYDE